MQIDRGFVLDVLDRQIERSVEEFGCDFGLSCVEILKDELRRQMAEIDRHAAINFTHAGVAETPRFARKKNSDETFDPAFGEGFQPKQFVQCKVS